VASPAFYLDESVDVAVAEGARRQGVVVTTARDEGRLGLSDELQLAFARDRGLVFVTHDRGFERRHWAGEHHAGLLYIPASTDIGRMVEWLVIASTAITADEFVGRFEYCG
jgi:hypothetical protein